MLIYYSDVLHLRLIIPQIRATLKSTRYVHRRASKGTPCSFSHVWDLCYTIPAVIWLKALASEGRCIVGGLSCGRHQGQRSRQIYNNARAQALTARKCQPIGAPVEKQTYNISITSEAVHCSVQEGKQCPAYDRASRGSSFSRSSTFRPACAMCSFRHSSYTGVIGISKKCSAMLPRRATQMTRLRQRHRTGLSRSA